jgi:peroxiredoxin
MLGKKFMKKLMLSTLFAAIISHGVLHAAAQPGQPAPDFKLRSSDDKWYSLKNLKGKFIVLEWFNFGCPFTEKFYLAGEMQKLQREFTSQGVSWLSICSSAPGKEGYMTLEEAEQARKQNNVTNTATLIDDTGQVGKLYGAKTTPHMFVINPDGVIIYAGAIDSIPSTNQQDIPKAKNYVRAALQEAMAGKMVSTPLTDSYGCSVKY